MYDKECMFTVWTESQRGAQPLNNQSQNNNSVLNNVLTFPSPNSGRLEDAPGSQWHFRKYWVIITPSVPKLLMHFIVRTQVIWSILLLETIFLKCVKHFDTEGVLSDILRRRDCYFIVTLILQTCLSFQLIFGRMGAH